MANFIPRLLRREISRGAPSASGGRPPLRLPVPAAFRVRSTQFSQQARAVCMDIFGAIAVAACRRPRPQPPPALSGSGCCRRRAGTNVRLALARTIVHITAAGRGTSVIAFRVACTTVARPWPYSLDFSSCRSPSRSSPHLRRVAQFTGTEQYHRFWFGISLLTDGVAYLAEQAGCHWLLDAIGSYQPELAKHADDRLQCLQFWKLKVNGDKSAVLTCVADSGEPPAVTQNIEWTDFPLPEIDIWVGVEGDRKIALLPSEY